MLYLTQCTRHINFRAHNNSINSIKVLSSEQFGGIKKKFYHDLIRLKKLHPDLVHDEIQCIYRTLKCVSLIFMNNEAKCSDSQLLEFTGMSVHFVRTLNGLGLLMDECEESGEALGVPIKMLEDVITLFGLFNVFNVNNLTKDLVKTTKMDKRRNELTTVNRKFYEWVQKNAPFDHSSLILYNLKMLNLNIENKSAILDLFKKIRSIDELRMLSTNMASVSGPFLFLLSWFCFVLCESNSWF